MLNKRGGVEADLTVSVLNPEDEGQIDPKHKGQWNTMYTKFYRTSLIRPCRCTFNTKFIIFLERPINCKL